MHVSSIRNTKVNYDKVRETWLRGVPTKEQLMVKFDQTSKTFSNTSMITANNEPLNIFRNGIPIDSGDRQGPFGLLFL